VNNDFEPVMAALFAHLQGAVVIPFTANATAADATLMGITDPAVALLFPGLPVFGPGVVRGATIASLDLDAGTVTLSDPLDQGGDGVAFTTGFLSASRRTQHWNQVDEQPALFLRRIGVTDEPDELFMRTTLECEAWIYCNAGEDPALPPDSALTSLEQLVRQSFAADGDYGDPRFTLGGMVDWCRIEGRGTSSPGDQGGQAISLIPIRITLP